MILNNILHPFLLLPINRNGQDLKLTSISFKKFFQKNDILFAGQAPGTPEKEEKGFAFKLIQGDLLSIQIFERERGEASFLASNL